MFELKPLSREAVGRALEKAERYRLLSEPGEAESICLDVLRVDPENQQALVTLLLARTDQFDEMAGEVARARDVVPRLAGGYEQAYYAGIIHERQAKVQLKHAGPGMRAVAQARLREAMSFYEKAEGLRPAGNDDALLRWNACARVLERLPQVDSAVEEYEAPLE
jgi:tetratricopeptide (TPR) repeat protein